MVQYEVAGDYLHLSGRALHPKRRYAVGETGSKKDKNKAKKQKEEQLEKKKEQQKTTLPVKKPA